MTIKRRKPIFSREARADLRAIFKYIEATNPKAAKDFVLDINLKIRTAAEIGLTGVTRDEIDRSLRALPYRNRCIYFRVEESRIYIVRILHGRQDLSLQDFPESET